MGKINKEGYERKREWAANRMAANKEINTLTEEQHDALANLASFRHELHTNQKSLFNTGSANYDNFWKMIWDGEANEFSELNEKLNEVGLPLLPRYSPLELSNDMDFNDVEIIDGDIIYEVGIDSENERWQDKYDYAYSEVIDYAEKINTDIENYLSEIDEKYDTNYTPTGASRLGNC